MPIPRHVRRVAATLIAAALTSAAHAAAPLAKTTPPGFYRFMLGDIEVTTLFDGALSLKASELLKGIPAQAIARRLAAAHEKEPWPTSVNAFLINTGGKLVLIDTGAGVMFGPGLNALVDNLVASGYRPEQIDEIYITHLHGDHIGGLLQGDSMAFPNAVVRAGQADADTWLDAAAQQKATGEAKAVGDIALKVLKPYVDAGHFKGITQDGELVPGVRAVGAHGHTPGHTTYLVESRGQQLLLVGDLIHVGAVQFPQPQVTITFDSDAEAAAAARKKAFDGAARSGALIGAAHLPFPGIGHLHVEGTGYRYMPLEFVPLK